MKKGIIVLLAVMMAAFMVSPVTADRNGYGRNVEKLARGRDNNHGDYRDRDSNRRDRERNRDHVRDRSHDRKRDRVRDRNHARDHKRGYKYDYRRPDHRPHGYRPQPRGRHYGNPHLRKGHSYRYDGHWNSYSAWEGYRNLHPERFHHGGYYRESGHLFFRFCEPSGSACFFFSIGR